VIRKQAETTARKHLNVLYPFAYVLIPDDLQAKQLIIDAYSVKLIDRNLDQDDKLFLMMEIWNLAIKRYHQVINGLDVSGPYWKLTIEERSILYLKYKAKLNNEVIEQILGIMKSEFVNKLILAKASYFQNMGMDPSDDFTFVPKLS
jgi:hypothetical protein